MSKNFEFKELGKLGKSISVQEMTGNDTVYLRLTKLYKDESGAWHPTKQGVSIPISEVLNLQKMVQKFLNTHDVPETVFTETELTSDLSDL